MGMPNGRGGTRERQEVADEARHDGEARPHARIAGAARLGDDTREEPNGGHGACRERQEPTRPGRPSVARGAEAVVGIGTEARIGRHGIPLRWAERRCHSMSYADSGGDGLAARSHVPSASDAR